jgi:hypothetical protein
MMDEATVESQRLADRIGKLKTSLADIEKQLTEVEVSRDALEDFKTAVDQTRMTVWGILSTPDTDLLTLMAQFRMKHATDMCQRIIVDVVSGLPIDPVQLQRFRATLEDTLDQLKRGF